MVPLSVAHGVGVVAGGISLDNTIRIGASVPTEWVLVDLRAPPGDRRLRPRIAHVWSPEGRLLATASQSASMFQFDLTDAPWGHRA
jgi:acyl-CoA thioesterase